MTLSEELLWRGFHHQTTFKNLSDLDTETRTFYFGVDPSAPSAQAGNLAAMMMCKTFIRHGYKPIMLVGGATGRVGDPKDNEERTLKADIEVETNVKGLKNDYQKIFGINDLVMVDNYDWFKDFTFLDFMRHVGKKFGMGQLLDREFVKARIGKGKAGVSFAEFGYGLIQGYDYLHLYKNHGVTLQLCGSDQWGNCILGVDLIRKEENAESHIWSMPLIINKSTGRKFGKSEVGTIWLNSDLTSPYKFYQFWLNVDDVGIDYYLKIFTELGHEEIDQIVSSHELNPGARLAQKRLATEVTRLVHGQDILSAVEQVTYVLFGSQYDKITLSEIEIMEAELKVVVASEDMTILDIVTEFGMSRSESRKQIQQGAVSINGTKCLDEASPICSIVDILGYWLVKKGKNSFILVKKGSTDAK
jgi:tyrosyl-tRNA synthetase